MRGARVQAVVNELQGEKVDIIQWNQDAASFIVNALAPAEVSKVVLDEDTNRIEVVVPETQLSLAIGRRGQNVRLASQLTGWDIDIVTEQEESERRQKEFAERSQVFMDALDVDEVIAQLLVTEGFATVEEVPTSIRRKSHISKASTRTRRAKSRRAPAITREAGSRARCTPPRTWRLGRSSARFGRYVRDARGARREWHQDTRGSRRLCDGRSHGLDRAFKDKDVEPVRHKGFLDGFDVGRKEAEEMIMSARVLAGWITVEEEPADEVAAGDEAEASDADA